MTDHVNYIHSVYLIICLVMKCANIYYVTSLWKPQYKPQNNQWCLLVLGWFNSLFFFWQAQKKQVYSQKTWCIFRKLYPIKSHLGVSLKSLIGAITLPWDTCPILKAHVKPFFMCCCGIVGSSFRHGICWSYTHTHRMPLSIFPCVPIFYQDVWHECPFCLTFDLSCTNQ